MAIVPNQLDPNLVDVTDDVTGATLSEGLPPDMLGSLYNPGAVAPPVPETPDTRTAGIDIVDPTTRRTVPTQTPGVSDIGQAFAPSITVGPAPGAAPAPVSAPGPSPQAAAPTPAAPSGPSTSFSPETEKAARAYAIGLMQPRAGVRVDKPARNVLRGFRVDVAAKLDPETKEETDLARELAFVRAQRLATEGGMLESAHHADAAVNFQKQRQDAQRQLSKIHMQEYDRDQIVGARMREIDMLRDDLHAKRANAKFGAEAYWEDKGVVGTILAKIGMALYAGGSGIAGYDPMGLTKEINAQAENYNAGKRVEFELLGKEIEGKESHLDNIRKNFISREAAEAATTALMNEAMIAETQELASHYKTEQSRITAQEIVNQLQAQAAEARAKAELAEKDAITQAWQHIEAMRGVVGGGPGKNPKQVADILFPGDPEGVLKVIQLAQEGKIGPGKMDYDIWKTQTGADKSAGSATMEKFHQQGTIQLPDGTYAYIPNQGEATRVQKAMHALPKLRDNLKRMKSIATGVTTIDKLSPEDRATLKTLASANARLIKDEIGEALTAGEYETLWSGLTGGSVNDIWRLANEEKQLDTAINVTKQFEDKEISKLRKVPKGVDPGEPLRPPVIEEPDEK